MNKTLGLIIIGCFLFCGFAEASKYVVVCASCKQVPQDLVLGTQFDSNTVFIKAWGQTPGGYLTRDGGKTWSQFTIQEAGKVVSVYDNVYIEGWFAGHILISHNGEFYCNTNNRVWDASSICSIVLRGQDGLRIKDDKGKRKYLERTIDGGTTWVGAKGAAVLFNRFDSFDVVSSNLFFALVSSENDAGLNHSLISSSNGGKTWSTLCITDDKLDIYATHLFFLNSKTGWISSDRDDGLFRTDDGGSSWTRITIPERIAAGIFFRNSQVGRIIGGLSNNIYETNDGGKTWRKMPRHEVVSQSFPSFFTPEHLSRWNDFAVLRTLAQNRKD